LALGVVTQSDSRKQTGHLRLQQTKAVSPSFAADPAIDGHGSAPITAASTPQESLVQDLKLRLQAANVREQELHQHLLHHMQGEVPLILLLWPMKRCCLATFVAKPFSFCEKTMSTIAALKRINFLQ